MIFDIYNQYFNGGRVASGGFIYSPVAVDYTYLNVGSIEVEKYISAGIMSLEKYVDAGDLTINKYLNCGEMEL